jgi:hypothetical protein
MKLAELLRPVTKEKKITNEDLDEALVKILEVEAGRDQASEAVEKAQKKVDLAQASALDGEDGADVGDAVAALLAAKETLTSAERLLKQAKDQAIALIAADSGRRHKRLEAVQEELDSLRFEIDRRTLEACARFAKSRGFSLIPPTKNNAGHISIPALSLGPEESQRVIEIASDKKVVDPKQGQLEKLRKEKTRLNMLTRTPPPGALDVLLAERRR